LGTSDGGIIYQRPQDGYINATAMCQSAGRQFGHYRENKTSKEFLAELSFAIGIPIAELVQSVVGGDPRFQGTWVHPQAAIHLGQWVSAPFAVQVSQWVYDWMSGQSRSADIEVPYHLRRYVANYQNVPVGHFSMLTEMTQALIAPMEIMGYRLPESMAAASSANGCVTHMASIPTRWRPTCTFSRMGVACPQRVTPKVCLRIFAGIFEKSGCRTAPSTISGAGTVKLCSTCQS
jgi:hypothetical protein